METESIEKSDKFSGAFELLASEIKEIKTKLVSLDDKVSKKFEGKHKKTNKTEKKPLNEKIYPSWWAHNASIQQSDTKTGQKWEDNEWRRKHELDCTAVAQECLKQNKIASTRKPVKMLFDKKEFSRPYLYKDPTPKIIAKHSSVLSTATRISTSI